jgi:hypothetical protein
MFLCECRPSCRECFCMERGASPCHLEPRPWLPGGCTGRTWPVHACLRHGCGPRTPLRAQGLAAGQPSHVCGRQRRAGAPGTTHVPGLADASRGETPSFELGFNPSVSAHVLAQAPRHAAPAASSAPPDTGWMRRAPCTRPRAHPASAPQSCAGAWLPVGQAIRRTARAILLDVALRRAQAEEAKA